MDAATLTARADNHALLQLARFQTGPRIQAVRVDDRAVARLRKAGLVTAAGKLTAAGRARAAALQAAPPAARPTPKPPARRAVAGGKLPRIYG